MNLQQAKARLLIPELMLRLGVRSTSIPATGCNHAKCPWPENHNNADNKPSFSLYAGGQRAHCFGCGFEGDAPTFLSKWHGISNAEACKRFIQMAEGGSGGFSNRQQSRLQLQAPPSKRTPSRKLVMPSDVSSLTDEQINQVAASRQLDVSAVQYAANLQVLRYASVFGEPCWMLMDKSLHIAEARRLDGKLFPAIGDLGARKAHTIRGSCKAWPVGAALLSERPEVRIVLLVEGGPDYLAALHFILRWRRTDILPVAMLGSGAGTNEIHVAAKRLLAGKTVYIYPHNDPNKVGLRAAGNWRDQLRSIGCKVEIKSLTKSQIGNGAPLKDLNDLAAQTISIQPSNIKQ